MNAPTIAKKISPCWRFANMEETIVFYKSVLDSRRLGTRGSIRSWNAMARPSTL